MVTGPASVVELAYLCENIISRCKHYTYSAFEIVSNYIISISSYYLSSFTISSVINHGDNLR